MAAPTALIVNYTRIQTLTSYFQHCRRSKRWINLKTVNRRSSFCQSLKRLELNPPLVHRNKACMCSLCKTRVFPYRGSISSGLKSLYVYKHAIQGIQSLFEKVVHSGNTFCVFEYSATLWVSQILSIRCLSISVLQCRVDYNAFDHFPMCLAWCIVTYVLFLSHRHVATVVSGTELARQIHKEVQSDIAKLVAQGNSRPHLSVILVGDDHASHTYVRNKTRTASLLGEQHTKSM